jgi:hypothetical protein
MTDITPPPPLAEEGDEGDRLPIEISLSEEEIQLLDGLSPETLEKMIEGFILRRNLEDLLQKS